LITQLKYVIILLAFVETLQAQEIHFSQISNNQILINPSTAGNFDGTLRFGGNYRSQGASLSVPYITYSAWGEFRLEPKSLNHSAIGLGISLFNDKAGDGGLQTTSGYLTASFIKGFNQENTLQASLGFSVGVINRSINFSKLFFDNQWNGTVFDPDVASGEPYSSNSVFSPDFNFGGCVSWAIDEKIFTTFGAALHHINRPKLTFYESESRIENKLVFHGLVQVKISEQLQIVPGFYYSTQQNVNEMLVGSNLLIVQDNLKFITGLWYRFERDVIPHAGIVVNDFIVEFSYDINVSKLHIATNYRGGMEISIIKTISLKQNRTRCYGF
jgi:type IX secretion system PorP/SprF family membrane protein